MQDLAYCSACTHQVQQLATRQSRDGGKRAAHAVAAARTYIESHLAEPLTLSDISRVACMSRYHLARRFRHATGTSPMQYLLQLRIRRAQELLQRPRSSISAIAVELGFFDQSHFTRSFRRATGITPGHYARRQAAVDIDASIDAHAIQPSSTRKTQP